MTDELITSEQLKDAPMQFATEVPTQADPDAATGAIDCPVGYCRMKLASYVIEPDVEYTRKGETFVCHKLRPTLEIVEGEPYAGARTIDFIPLPMAGHTVSVDMMNQWYNFVRAFGVEVPRGAAAPQGFHLNQIIDKEAVVQIVVQTDRDGNKKINKDGRELRSPRYFGYHSIERYDELCRAKDKEPSTTKPAAKTAASGFSL